MLLWDLGVTVDLGTEVRCNQTDHRVVESSDNYLVRMLEDLTWGGPLLFVALVIFGATPLLNRLFLKLSGRKLTRAGVGILWIGAIVVAYTDVVVITLETRRLCREEGGLHIYKTVEGKGFSGDTGIKFWSQYGFQYVESQNRSGQIFRYTMRNGKEHKEKVSEFRSRYEYTLPSDVIESRFRKIENRIRDRHTGEILGKMVYVQAYPGWADSVIFKLLGNVWLPPGCDGDYLPRKAKRTLHGDDLVTAVIKPGAN